MHPLTWMCLWVLDKKCGLPCFAIVYLTQEGERKFSWKQRFTWARKNYSGVILQSVSSSTQTRGHENMWQRKWQSFLLFFMSFAKASEGICVQVGGGIPEKQVLLWPLGRPFSAAPKTQGNEWSISLLILGICPHSCRGNNLECNRAIPVSHILFTLGSFLGAKFI